MVVVLTAILTSCTATPEVSSPPVTEIGGENDKVVRDIVDCLHESGWAVELDELTDSYEFVGSASQADAYGAARDACVTEATAGATFAPLTDEQLSEIYEYEAWTAECLRNEGVDVPQIPSEQEFTDRYRSTDPWLAYNFIGERSESSYRALLEACPQL